MTATIASVASTWLLALGLSLLATASARAQIPSLPPLPQIPLDTYEPAIREPIEEAYEDARDKPYEAAPNGILGMALYAHEQYEFAVPCFERAHGIDPGEGRWAYYLGRVEHNLARYDRASAAFLETLQRRPGYLPAQVMLAQSLLEAGLTDQSLSLYEQLVEQSPGLAEVHYGLGRIFAGQGRTDSAIEHLQKACDLFPSFGAAHFALARVYRDRGERDKAREHLGLYQDGKDEWPALEDPWMSDIVALRNSATEQLRRGIQLAGQGQLEEAAEAHEAALEIDPELVQAHVNLIRIYGELGDVARAEEHYRAALAIDENLAELHYNYGVLVSGQDSAKAAEAFRRTLELKPTYAEAHHNYATILMTSGQLDEAARHYRAALQEKPDYRTAHFNLARILVSQGELDEAIAHLQETLLPDDEATPRFTYALGAAHARAGNRPEAVRYMKEAREKAEARGQSGLLASIDRDLQALEQTSSPQ